jgi:hypothetical protein
VTDLEKRAVIALRSVKMPEKNWHARRAGVLDGRMTMDANLRLTCSEAGDLWFLVWRYRRQIADASVVAKADEIVNGALKLEFEISL